MATNDRQLLGIVGENIACAELQQRGYEILARRYRTRHGEIDIVCEHEGTIVFVEVRARASAEFGSAAESITDAKKRKVSAMAADYLARNAIANRPCRFDVVAVDNAMGPSPEVTVYPNAFDAPGH